jgi:hypothetical protein
MEDVRRGIYLAPSLGPTFFQKNLSIARNAVAVKSDSGGFDTSGILLAKGSTPHTAVFRNVMLRENHVRRYGEAGAPWAGIEVADIDTGIVEQNWVGHEVGGKDRNAIQISYSGNVVVRKNTSRGVALGDGNWGVQIGQ